MPVPGFCHVSVFYLLSACACATGTADRGMGGRPEPSLPAFQEALRAGDFERAASEGERILRAALESPAGLDSSFVPLLNNLGGACHSIGDQARAIRHFFTALDLTGHEVHPHGASIRNNIGNVYHVQGDLPAARIWYERALVVGRRTLPAGHPSLATYACNLALTEAASGRTNAAARLYREALAIRRQALGEGHPLTVAVRNTLILLGNTNPDAPGVSREP